MLLYPLKFLVPTKIIMAKQWIGMYLYSMHDPVQLE